VSDSEPAPLSAPPTPGLRILSGDLFRGEREIVIVHGEQEYVLRITRSDKLILTK
jgi:hemin uptake protein HemP